MNNKIKCINNRTTIACINEEICTMQLCTWNIYTK